MNSKLKYYWKIIIWIVSLIVIAKAGAKAMLVLFSLYSISLLYKSFNHFQRLKSAILPIILLIAIGSTMMWSGLNSAQKKETKQSFVTFSQYVLILPQFLMNEFFGTEFQLEFDGNTSERFRFMGAAIQEYKKSPLLGIGAGQLYAKKVNWNEREVNVTSIHNYWLEILVIGGPFFFIFYIGWYGFITYKLMKSDQQINKTFGESMVLFFFAAPVMSSVFYFLPKWLLYGLSVSTLKLEKS